MFGGFQSVSVRYAGQKASPPLRRNPETPEGHRKVAQNARLATPPAFVYAAVLDPRHRVRARRNRAVSVRQCSTKAGASPGVVSILLSKDPDTTSTPKEANRSQ